MGPKALLRVVGVALWHRMFGRMGTLESDAIRSKEWEGRTIAGQFPLRQWLGSSDHSSVFLTERRGEKAAIKFVLAKPDTDAERQLARWRRAAELSHSSLIRIFESGSVQMDGYNFLYVVMEFADDDLAQILPQRPLAPGEVTQLLPPLLGALSFLHNNRFLHGRIKPSNVLATGDQLKLSADQIIPLASTDTSPTRRDPYDAPEIAAGVCSTNSDLWSVGVTLYTALTQKLPEEGHKDNPAQFSSIPEPFRGIVRSCLQLDPRQRSSIADILTRLDPEAARVERTAEPEPLGWRGKRVVASLFVLATAFVIALIVFLLSRKSQPTKPVQSAVEQQSSSGTPSTPAIVSSTSETLARSDSPGSVLHQALPDASQSARRTVTGKIRIVARVDVDAKGKVTHARLTTPGPSQYFARLALAAAERWQFSPPIVNSHPVASIWSITFRIGRKETQTTAARDKR
jgi:TonB family protein